MNFIFCLQFAIIIVCINIILFVISLKNKKYNLSIYSILIILLNIITVLINEQYFSTKAEIITDKSNNLAYLFSNIYNNDIFSYLVLILNILYLITFCISLFCLIKNYKIKIDKR